MKVIAFNGSPRKKGNTATLINHVLKGAESLGAETELIHLYDYNYKGCISCFACKLKGGKSYGQCGFQDELTPILRKIEEADALVIGSPIYLSGLVGEVRSFLERLIFQYLIYDAHYSSLFKKKIKTGFIYTMNVDDKRAEAVGYKEVLKLTESAVERILGPLETLYVTDTYQFEDYSKYETSAFNVDEKKRRHEEIFPRDCQKAFEMGSQLASGLL